MENFIFYAVLTIRAVFSFRNQKKLLRQRFLLPKFWDLRRNFKSSHLEVLLRKDVLKLCSKFTGENSYRSAISIKLLCNFIEITLCHGCSPVNLLHIFRTPFSMNTPGWLLLKLLFWYNKIMLWFQRSHSIRFLFSPTLGFTHYQGHY